MMEQQTLPKQQTTVERDALFPAEEKPTLTTSDVIIIGENSVEAPLTDEERYERTLQGAVNQSLKELDDVLVLKVTNELVTQVFRDNYDESLINVESVYQLVDAELQAEKDRCFQMAMHIENTYIPEAEQRTQPVFGDLDAYTRKDIPALQVRSETYLAMVSHIDAIQDTGEDSLHDLAEVYIERCLADARDKAIAILLEQKRALEAKRQDEAARIAVLEDTIVTLQRALHDKDEQVAERDLALYDHEVVDFMAAEARALAR